MLSFTLALDSKILTRPSKLCKSLIHVLIFVVEVLASKQEEKCVFLWRRTENEKEKTFEEGKLNGDNHPTTN